MFKPLMHNVPKWLDTTLKILEQMLQDFESVSDHFGTLCIKGLRSLASQFISDTASCKFEVMFDYLIFYGCAKLITLLLIIVKQSPEVLYKKSCSTLLKRNSNTVVFL